MLVCVRISTCVCVCMCVYVCVYVVFSFNATGKGTLLNIDHRFLFPQNEVIRERERERTKTKKQIGGLT